MLLYVHRFFGALLFSTLVEAVAVALIARWKGKNPRLAYLAAWGTITTLPYVWFVIPTLLWFSSQAIVPASELFAFLVEAGIYRFVGRLSLRYSLLFSLVANLASYILWKLIF